jgi:endonuclease YncB( thermonuclease family)
MAKKQPSKEQQAFEIDRFVRKAKLIDVVDGDTLDVQIDLGFKVFHELRLRLARINAAEKGTADGETARAMVAEWFMRWHKDDKETPIYIKSTKDRHDRWSRLVVEVWCNGRSLVDDLIASSTPLWKPKGKE